MYKVFFGHIRDFFQGLYQGIEQSDILSNQVCDAGTARHYILNAIDPMPGIFIECK